MDIGSLIPHLKYIDKIFISTIDKNIHKDFMKLYEPDTYFYDMIYRNENITGIKFIRDNFYKSMISFLHTKYFVPKIIRDNKLKFIEWLLKLNDNEINGYFRNYWKKNTYTVFSRECKELMVKYKLLKVENNLLSIVKI